MIVVMLVVVMLVVVSGCSRRGMMVRGNREADFYTMAALLNDHTWLSDTATDWQTGVDTDADATPSYDDLAAYPLGNGEVFGMNGLSLPLGTLTNLTGPQYQKQAGFFGVCTPAVSIAGESEHLPKQMVEWVREAGVVHTVQRNERLALHVYDWVAPSANVWYRLLVAENLSDGPLRNVELILATNNPVREARRGRMVFTRASSVMTLSVVGQGIAAESGFEVDVPADYDNRQMLEAVEGLPHLSCPIGTIGKGESGGKLFYLVFAQEGEETTSGEPASQVEAEGLEGLVRTYEQNSAWHKKGLRVGAGDDRIHDFIEIQKHIIRVQQAAGGGFSPMDKYTYTWIRDSVGPVRFFLQAGYYDEVKRYLEYQFMGNAMGENIKLNLALDIKPPADLKEPNWADVRVDRAEVPSYIVLQHYWYFQHTGDGELIKKHWDYLKRCIFGQEISARGTLHFHGDETYRFPGYCAFQAGLDVHDYVQLETQSADSAFEFVAAAEAMAEMAAHLELAEEEDVAEFEQIAERVRDATEKYYWMSDRGYYAPAMSDFTEERHRYPFATINMRPLWIGYAKVDEQQRRNVVNSLEYLWKEEGGVKATPDFGYYTTMVPGFVLYNLVEIGYPRAEQWVGKVLNIAEKSGGYAEMNTPEDVPAEDIWGKHRCRPWEGGINAHAVVHALLGVEADAVRNHLSLSPRIVGGWPALGAQNIPVGRNRVDLKMYASLSKRVYEITAQRSDAPPTVELHLRVPARRIRAIEGNFEEYGGRVGRQSSYDGQISVAITGIKMPAEQVVTAEVTYEFMDPPERGMESAKFYYGEAEVKGHPTTLLLTWNPDTYAHYKDELGRAVMGVDTKIPWPAGYLRGLLLPRAGQIGFEKVLLDVKTYPGGFKRPAYWTSGEGGRVLKEYQALGGKVEEAEATSELPRSYYNMQREQG